MLLDAGCKILENSAKSYSMMIVKHYLMHFCFSFKALIHKSYSRPVSSV